MISVYFYVGYVSSSLFPELFLLLFVLDFFSSFCTMVLFLLSPEFHFLLHTMPLNNFWTTFKVIQMCGLVLQIPPSDLYRTKENSYDEKGFLYGTME